VSHPQIIGILNVTPDSYFDGGKFTREDAAVKRAKEMLEQGADWIEIGGESTGPGSKDVSAEEETRRTIPVVHAIRSALPDAKIAVDTYKADVAKQAIAAGVKMINDVTAGRGDPKMFATVADSSALLVLVFSKDATPRTTISQAHYDDVVKTVGEFLAERRDAAIKAGIDRKKIILDPGMGHFVSSDSEYSLELIARLEELQSLGCPVYISPSRKSFVAGSENLKANDRLPGTIAASAIAVLNGATYIRTHDVLEVRRACEIASAIRRTRAG
jgi:dihydropteroate synthase